MGADLRKRKGTLIFGQGLVTFRPRAFGNLRGVWPVVGSAVRCPTVKIPNPVSGNVSAYFAHGGRGPRSYFMSTATGCDAPERLTPRAPNTT